MWTTGALSAEIAACDISTNNGVGHLAYVVNLDDIDKASTVVTDYAIASLVYNPGAAAFACTVMSSDEPEGNYKYVKGQYRNGWDHRVTLRFCINDTAIRLRVAELLRSRVVVILQLFDASGGSYFEVLGYELGLEVAEIDRNYNDQDTAGGWVVSFGCDDTFKEKDFPYILGTAPGTIVVDATEVGSVTAVITDADVIAGWVTVNTAEAVPVPVAAHLINSAGEVNHYDIQRVTDYQQKINLGEPLQTGTYTIKILYTQ